jgi:hypothetical protein
MMEVQTEETNNSFICTFDWHRLVGVVTPTNKIRFLSDFEMAHFFMTSDFHYNRIETAPRTSCHALMHTTSIL